MSTVFNLKHKRQKFIGFTVDEDGRDTYLYKWVYDDKLFVSPYTRKFFEWDDLEFVKMHYLSE